MIPIDCKTIQFTDDILLLCSYRDHNKIIDSLQTVFNRIQLWLETIGLELFLTKSQFVIFHKSRANLSPLFLQVNKSTILILLTVKYLGMHLDTRFRWTEHINFLRI